MNCSTTALITSLVAAGLSIATAAGFIAAAAIANGSFWGAILAPGLMLGAAIAATAAALSAGLALTLMEAYYQCLIAPFQGQTTRFITIDKRCVVERTSWNGAIGAIVTALSLQAYLCYGIAGVAAIPWAPLTAMAIVAGTLILQGFLLVALIPVSVSLANCYRDRLNP